MAVFDKKRYAELQKKSKIPPFMINISGMKFKVKTLKT